MHLFLRLIRQSVGLALSLVLLTAATLAQQGASGTLRGRIVDQFGGAIVGASVTVVDATGTEKTVTSNDEGLYVISGLAPGTYTVRAQATGFALFESAGVEVTAARREALDITLEVTIEQAEVTIAGEPPVSTDPENNAGAIVLRGTDIEALPEDPDELTEALQALAGPSAGPNGGQIFVDGFTGGRLPPRESIREIRINSNPFSAEYDRLGFGRIEILTKPGTDKFRGQAFFSFNDESLNSRNPFAPNRAPFQSRQFGGNVSGPLISKKASYFFDFERRQVDDNDIINATILDPSLNITRFGLAVLTPQTRTTFSPRFDYQLNANNTLVGRYSYTRTERENAGIGDFNLLSRAYNSSTTQHSLQLTETMIVSPSVINETRFQFVRSRSEREGDSLLPTIRVLDAFTGGGSQVGLSFNRETRWELANNTSWARSNHALKFGVRLRGISLKDVSPNNFAGTFTFAGGLAPQLDANNQVIPNSELVTISSIERYRRTLFFQGRINPLTNQVYTPAEIRALGGGATQFTIAGGNPESGISQVDFGAFVQDDWRVRPDFTLSLGLRYEAQTNINTGLNFAPRIAFAWSPGAGGQRQAKTVIRGGFGIFFDRVSEDLSLQASRFNGTNQQQFLVTDPSILDLAQFTIDGVTNVPTVETLSAFSLPQTTWRVADSLQSPYTIQSSISLERQLPHNWTFSATFINSRSVHLLRARNINAPVPGTGVRPLGNIGNIYQYESSGQLNQNQLLLGIGNRLNRTVSLFARYSLSKAESDTDGAGTFPANQYDLTSEWGRASFDVRHRFIVGGTINAPWGLRLNPLVIWTSGRPFNITTGRDTNNDSLFTERPAIATDLTKPGVIVTRFGAFDPNPALGQEIIPRNYGDGPSFFNVNLGLSKTFGFGGSNRDNVASAAGQDGSGPGAGGGRGRGGFGSGGGSGGGGFGGGGGGRGGRGGGASTENRYNLTFSVQVQNLFNTTNEGTPVGNLSSPRFGESLSTAGGFGFGGGGGNPAAGNRRIIGQVRFSF
jgi:hypothetical protein